MLDIKMKGIYLNITSEKEIGVQKKINYQIKSLRKLGNNIEKIEIRDNKIFFEETKLLKISQGNDFISKVFRKLQTYVLLIALMKKKYYKDVEYIYVRYFYSSIFSINYFKFLKKLGIKIIIEIPTFPYDTEIKKENIITRLDKKYRLKLYKYIDKIVTYSEDKKIWNIPCINISNGIDLEEVQMIKKKQHSGINFISVSNCSFWHGIDRFLYSLLQYIKNGGKEELKLYIVGDGNETFKLKRIVEENIDLQKVIIFCGVKFGKELDEIYAPRKDVFLELDINPLKI